MRSRREPTGVILPDHAPGVSHEPNSCIAVSPEFDVRLFTEDDMPAVIRLLASSLGWQDDDRHARLFRWKHIDNPSGPSPAWLATANGRVVAFRTFMRWTFAGVTTPLTAVRAVDTATHPDHQGRGLFSLLTRQALSELQAEGINLVFNTPNDRSRPGYLKMGWREVGRLPLHVRPAGLIGAFRLAQARVSAELWSETSDAGTSAADALADTRGLEHLLAGQQRRPPLSTEHSAEFLRWRYAEAPLGYRAVTGRAGIKDGVAIFRVRRRGASREVAIGEVLAPGGEPRARSRLARTAARVAGGDHAVLVGRSRPRGFITLPGVGPVLTRRDLTAGLPPDSAWHLSLGDVELF